VSPPPIRAERRLCTVLFVDLVGFTALSEARDPEEVRELLSRYFADSRMVIERYGGTVEKFIGDAVMAVWGTPRALEGDTERAVRAALDLVAAVADLGVELGLTTLSARAGVVTGEVAVNLDARGEGMVAGDAVNTASRVQGVARPGEVLVDAATRRLATPGIEFGEAGAFELKGKVEVEPLWQALHVVSGVGGSQRVDGLEAPLVGRDLEFRLVKDLLHTVIREREPRLVVVTGAAGVGKSRLGWEFEKYVDGIADPVYWHRGRCLPFGEDTAFWALAEIVRARLGVAEDDVPEVVATKLERRLEQFVPDPDERGYISIRIARMLGVSVAGDTGVEIPQQDLFAGWRLFFERLAAGQPVLLLIEDAQHADPGLLDFVEHLVDWSRGLPIMVLVFTRPEIEERRPGFGLGRRRTLLALDPLPTSAMRRLLDGLVPGMPEAAADSISAQAQGMPLFAVETIRSLIDQDVVVPSDGVYRLVADVGRLAVPQSLQSLIAARLDALDPIARSLVADAAIIGGPFTAEMLVAISEVPEGKARAALQDLVHRDLFQISADELSPQLGSYSFSHGLVAQVAYGTLSRRDRKARHLKIAAHLTTTQRNEGDALADVIARHYLDALEARPDDEDGAPLRESASGWLMRAAEHATKRGAPASAARCFATAAELEDPHDQQAQLAAAPIWESAARAALTAGDGDVVVAHALRAVEIYRRHGDAHRAARAETLAGRGHHAIGRNDEARASFLRALSELEKSPDTDTVDALSSLATLEALLGEAEADVASQRALDLGQRLDVRGPLLARLLLGRGMVHAMNDRFRQAETYYREGARVAEDCGDAVEAARAIGNLADTTSAGDPAAAAEYALSAMRMHRRLGSRLYLLASTATYVFAALETGDWDGATDAASEAVQHDNLDGYAVMRDIAAYVWLLRGDIAQAASFSSMDEALPDDDPQLASLSLLARAERAHLEGETRDALELATSAVEHALVVGGRHEGIRWAWALASRAAYEVGDDTASRRLLELTAGRLPGQLSPLGRAEMQLARARLTSPGPERFGAVEAAVETMRGVGSPYHLAHALLDLEEACGGQPGPASSAMTDEAAAIAAKLHAAPLARRAELLKSRQRHDTSLSTAPAPAEPAAGVT
jgi:class 3 adenylate cyclase/tetratricopeptide (TPR) repeat protein